MIHNLRLDASRITYGVIAVFPGTGDDSGQGAHGHASRRVRRNVLGYPRAFSPRPARRAVRRHPHRRGLRRIAPGGRRRAGHARVHPRDGRGGEATQARAGTRRRPGSDRSVGGSPRDRAGERLRPRGRHRGIRAPRHARVHARVRAARRRASRGALGEPVGRRLDAATAVGGAGRQDAGHSRVRANRARAGSTGARLRHDRVRDSTRRRAIAR